MHTTLRTAIGFGLIAAVTTLGTAAPAWSDDDHHGRDAHDRRDARESPQRRDLERREFERREFERRAAERQAFERRREAELRDVQLRRAAEHREWERRREFERHRAAAAWRFERGHGWRWERSPGVWSPYFVWWAIDGRPLLRPYPTVRIVRYSTGYYELAGDGVNVPFYWVWRPTVVVASAPVPPPPAPPAEYPLPTEGGYPPPPPLPPGYAAR